MRPLSAQATLQLWEQGQRQHALDRAVTLLHAALPDADPRDLAALPVGRRDALLLEVYARTFGPLLESLASCPCCGEALEFSLDADALRASQPDTPDEFRLREAGYEVQFRLPNSFDLASLVQPATELADTGAARDALLRRCVLGAEHEGRAVDVAEFPTTVVAALAAAVVARDPLAEVLLDLTCPACGHAWQALFDIVSFLWSAIRDRARRLLGEVHVLARAYGWSEPEILALSALRRQQYLELLQ